MYIYFYRYLYFLLEGFLIMIKKYVLLTSFVFGVGTLFVHDCEAKCCYVSSKHINCECGKTSCQFGSCTCKTALCKK